MNTKQLNKAMGELIKKYETQLADILIFYKVKNIYGIDNVKSRTVAEILRDVIFDLKRLKQLTKQRK